jgi:thiamine transporter
MTSPNVKAVVTTAILVAIAIITDVISSSIPGLNASMPFGGKFFGISMIPLVFIGLIFGLRYGLLGGFIYALYNFGADYIIYLDTLRITLESWTGETWSFFKIFSLFMLDYAIPFMAFGLSGLFKHSSLTALRMLYALSFVSMIRLVSSSASGVLLWSSSIAYASSEVEAGNIEPNIATQIFDLFGNNVWFYSIAYNFLYIISTLVVSYIIGFVIYKRVFKSLNIF